VFAHVRDGKIAELWEIVDVASLSEQLGQQARDEANSDGRTPN
jgi:hypothetical protein